MEKLLFNIDSTVTSLERFMALDSSSKEFLNIYK